MSDVRYTPVSQSQHGQEEERQWARVVASGDPARGVALVFIQKLCTAFHEIAPAWHRGALNPTSLDYFRQRLAAREQVALQVLEANGLGEIDGVAQLRALLQATETAESLEELAALAEPVHAVSHALCDALESGRHGTALTRTV